MPLPVPTPNEPREEFIERCMLDPAAMQDYPENGNRYVFCSTRWENKVAKSDEPRTLYISRKVINADAIIAWAKAQGFKTTFKAEDLHVTVAYSKAPLDWFDIPHGISRVSIPAGGPRAVQRLGDAGAVVLRFNSASLADRWKELRQLGASWDYDSYRPHITITMEAGNLDLSKVEPFAGEILLGIEHYSEIHEDWTDGVTEKVRDVSLSITVEKVAKEKRIAYGWFSVIEEKGKTVVDHHGDVIGEDTLVEAAHQYVQKYRAGKVMHSGEQVGEVVESVVFTKELQKALGIDLKKVGWFGGIKFSDEKQWARVKSGELREFSIGGFSRKRVPLKS